MSDPIIESVIEKLRSRSKVGMEKYGVGLNREDLSVVEWLIHHQQELLDAAGYVEVLIQKLGGKKKEEVYGPPPPTLQEAWKMEREAIGRHLQEANRKQVEERRPVWPSPIYGDDIVGVDPRAKT